MEDSATTVRQQGLRPGAGRPVLAKTVIVSLLETADSLRRFMGEVVARHDLTLQQFNVLRILRGAGPEPLPTMTIADRMIEKTPGVTRFLDTLEERGLIVRKRCNEDRRRVHAWITAAGLQLLSDMDDEVESADVRAIDGLSAESMDQLLDLLGAIHANVEGPEGEAVGKGMSAEC